MVPAVFAEGEYFSQRLPIKEIVADGKVSLVADFASVGDVDHKPPVFKTKNTRAVKEASFRRLQDNPVFERRFCFIVNGQHQIGGDFVWHGQPGSYSRTGAGGGFFKSPGGSSARFW